MVQLEIRKEAERMRGDGYSYSLISEKTGISKSTLSGWFHRIPYTPNAHVIAKIGKARAASGEQKARSRQVSLEKARLQAKEDIVTMNKRDLFMFGLGLYLGEGSKTGEVRIVNADPKVIRYAVAWFKALGVTTDQFAPRIHLYPDTDPEESLCFWSKVTTIPKPQFHKPYVDMRTNKKAIKRGKLTFGTLHLGVRSAGKEEFGVLFARKINAWSEEALRKLEKAGLV
jgi:hypothetical protein